MAKNIRIRTRIFANDFSSREKITSFLSSTNYDVIDGHEIFDKSACDLVIACINPQGNLSTEVMLYCMSTPKARLVVLALSQEIITLPRDILTRSAAVLDRASNRNKLLITLDAVMIGVNVRDPDFIATWYDLRDVSVEEESLALPTLVVPAAKVPDCKFSMRERDVLSSLTEGVSNKIIARRYNITEATVKVHVKNILRKLNMHNRTQVAIWAKDNSLLRI